jgi:ferredoxin
MSNFASLGSASEGDRSLPQRQPEREGNSSAQSLRDRTGTEPELGGRLRDQPQRSGLEPELGGTFRQRGVYVDEATCIGCRHCALVARNTFFIEEGYGRSRVFRQDGDAEEVVQEAIDTCPVDCIHWVDYTRLKQLERERKDQVIVLPGSSTESSSRRRRKHL